MTDSYPFCQITDDGETIVTTTRPTPGPEYETLEMAEHDEALLYRVVRAHQAYRDMLRHAIANVEHPLARGLLTDARRALSDIMADHIGPAYENASDEADRLDPDLSLDAPRRAG